MEKFTNSVLWPVLACLIGGSIFLHTRELLCDLRNK